MKKAFILYPVITICLCINFCFHSLAQQRQFLLSDAEVLFGKKQSEIYNVLASRDYRFIQNVDGVLEYKRTTPWGYFDLSLLFSKSGKLRSFLWQEHIVYANEIANEIKIGGYIRDEVNQIPGTDVVINGTKNLRILITPHPETNSISLSMQIPPSTSPVTWFTGTKKFCDEDGTWYYKVSIAGNNITLQSYPGEKNTFYKNKTKPVEIIRGVIRRDKIVTPDPPKYKTNRFKFENGILYEVNDEGEYNEYNECEK